LINPKKGRPSALGIDGAEIAFLIVQISGAGIGLLAFLSGAIEGLCQAL
jgi:hypothetical protein